MGDWLAALNGLSLMLQSPMPDVTIAHPPAPKPIAKPQPQSRFLNLPMDVRYLIYDAAYEHVRIELEVDTTRIATQRDSSVFPYHLKNVGPATFTGWIDLLLTCRQTHEECLRTVYRSPTFVFTSLRTLRSFLWTTPEKSLASVRRIEVAIRHVDGFSLPYNFLCPKIGNPDEWTDLFSRLAKMHALDRLDLWMQDERKTLSAIEARPWQRIAEVDVAWGAALEARHRCFWEGLARSKIPVQAHINWDGKDEERERVLVHVMTKQDMYNTYWAPSTPSKHSRALYGT